MGIKVIITGATGMVGEGVLLHCLQSNEVDEVLIVNRKHHDLQHPKLKECIIPDFMKLGDMSAQLAGYDACFYCAGVSSVGMDEAKYTYITYDTTMNFARKLADVTPGMVFTYVSGASTDSSEQGRSMWARVKGRTENALMKLPFKGVYNFRPGGMTPVEGQKNVKTLFRILLPVFSLLLPSKMCSLHQVGQAMINAVSRGYNKQVLEIKDIKALAKA